MAGGISANGASWALQLLRGIHSHSRLDVQPTRKKAESYVEAAWEAEALVAQLSARIPRLAAGPQRLYAPGPRVHRPRRQQKGRSCPCVPSAGRELPAFGDGHCLRSRHYANVVIA